MLANFLEGHPVAAVVQSRLAETDLAALENVGNSLSNFPDAIILCRVSHVQYFVMDSLERRLKRCGNSLANVQRVNQRAPGGSVAGHLDLFRRPCQSRQIVQHDIKPHAWRGAKRRRVS